MNLLTAQWLEFHISYHPWQHFLANCMQRCVNFTYEHLPAHVVFQRAFSDECGEGEGGGKGGEGAYGKPRAKGCSQKY